MGEEFYDDYENVPERCQKRREEKRDQIIQKRKKYLKYAICSLFGIALGLIFSDSREAVILLGLFGAYVFAAD